MTFYLIAPLAALAALWVLQIVWVCRCYAQAMRDEQSELERAFISSVARGA